MKLEEFKIYCDFVRLLTSFAAQALLQKAQTVVHKYTYQASKSPRNVVVIGGSFAGSHMVQRLAQTLPSGYRVVLLEKHSHFNHAFAFPRNAVFSGRESRAFIPYDNIAAGAPNGIFQRVCDEALDVTDKHIKLGSGHDLSYDYLVLATGAAQPPPARLLSQDRTDAISELQGFQQRISGAERIAVVGGGAVGVELVSEIRDKYPNKKLSLLHSRDQLLPRFGSKLHEWVMPALEEKKIEVLMGERPSLPPRAGEAVRETSLTLASGETRTWDLVIPCTGLRPRSGILAEYSPKSIAQNGEIIVKPTLQIDHLPSSKENIFAIGDVAQTGGPKQGRAGLMQAEVAVSNIVRLIKNRANLKEYKPSYFEGSLTLTLGKGSFEWVMKRNEHDLDVGAGKHWQKLHANPVS
ncbi:hypothetical protein FDECE_1323 [Fusarium decemcellulare]|nr:hypothetical protein FDECE_1323 [Fusarium decemcellulare]